MTKSNFLWLSQFMAFKGFVINMPPSMMPLIELLRINPKHKDAEPLLKEEVVLDYPDAVRM